MRSVSLALAFAASTFLSGSLRAQTGPRSDPVALDSLDLARWLDSLVSPSLKAGDIPGAVVVVVKDGRILFAKGYGFADVGRAIPMDPERTVLGVGSISKLFTWTAAMQQVEHGKLDLDRDINDYLDFRIPPAFGKPITLRHLMTHTAGFEEHAFRRYRHPRALSAYLRETAAPDRIFPPGEVAAYSNYGAMLAGYLVERVSGEPFTDYVARHILEPLDMGHSSFRRPVPAPLAARMSQSYEAASSPPLPADALDHEEPSGDPSGHLATTGLDIARFMEAHLARGRLDSFELLAPATADLMHAPAFTPLPGANPGTLGFFRTDRNGRRVISHAGDIEGFHADLRLLPDAGVGFFLALNGSGARRGIFGAAHLFRTTVFNRFMDRYFPAAPPPDEPTVSTAGQHARLVAGEYQMSRRPAGDFAELEMLFARATIGLVITANQDGTITTPPVLDFERGLALTWREVGPFSWREVGGLGRLDMRVENDRVVAWLPRDLFSFVLQPIPPAKAARLNVGLLAAAALILGATVILWPILVLVGRRSGRPPSAELASTRLAAVVGLVYLLGWAALLGTEAPTREGGEPWIRLVQGVGLLSLIATLVAVRSAWRIARRGGWPAVATATLVALAMVETVWLSLGFHLLSVRLVY